MMFWKNDAKQASIKSRKILERLGHQFATDWVPVRHQANNNYHLEHPNDNCLIDALSIQCSVENCERFDLNAELNEGAEVRNFLLWKHCITLATMSPEAEKITENNYTDKSMIVCIKYRSMI